MLGSKPGKRIEPLTWKVLVSRFESSLTENVSVGWDATEETSGREPLVVSSPGTLLSWSIWLSWLIVRNINEIHAWMGKQLHVTVWNPEVYLFDKIPNTMDPFEVTVIVGIAILASVLGALVPAIRAARLNPVEALRWE